MIVAYQGKKPQIASRAFIASTAILVGDVEIGEEVSVWFVEVLRGDYGRITIGRGSNAQDNAMIRAPFPLVSKLEPLDLSGGRLR